MFRQAENKVKIEGILAEINLNYGSFVKNGETVESIGGSIKVLVNQEINHEPKALEVPVYMFATKYTKTGKANPSYESIEKVMKEYVSIAAAGGAANADKVRITGAAIKMNEFPGQDGKIVSQPRVTASFVSKVVGDFKPEASFSVEFMVSEMNHRVDNEGVEIDPAVLDLKVIVPQYTAQNSTTMNVDLVPLVANIPSVLSAVELYWEPGKCYRASGRLNFSSKAETQVMENGFGEPQTRVRTINVSEFIITGGSQEPLDGDFAWSMEDIKAGMAARKMRLNEQKNRKAGSKQTPAQDGPKKKLDLGF